MSRTFTLFSEGLVSGPTVDETSSGPYYHNGAAYWFYKYGPSQQVRGKSTTDFSTFTSVGVSSRPTYSVNQMYLAGFAEYLNGGTHYLYCLVGTNPSFTVDPLLFDLWRYDFNLDAWSLISTGNAFDPGVPNTASNGYNYGLSAPFVSCNNTGWGWMLRCDANTGDPYVISYSLANGATDTQTIGYQHYSAGAWGAFVPVLSGVAGGLVMPSQAWVTAGVVYIVVAVLGVTASALNKTLTYVLVRGDGVLMTSAIDTYRFNDPGCPPFFEPTFTKFQNLPEGTIPPTFAFNWSTGYLSPPISFGGAIYMAAASPTRNLRVYKFSGTTMSTYDTAETVMFGQVLTSAQGRDYWLSAGLLVFNGALNVVWKRQTDFQRNFASPLNNTCAALASANYPAQYPKNDWYLATVSSVGVLGTPQAFDVGLSEQGISGFGGAYHGTMPAYLAGVGLTFAVFEASALAILGPPLGVALACPVSGAATLGALYSGTLIPSGGTGPYTFSLTSGALPPGLTLNTSTGEISGIPLGVGDYPYTVQATDSLGAVGTADCSITVSGGLVRGMSILTAKQFSELREKGLTGGLPTDIYFDQEFPNAGFHVWPIPNLAHDIEFYYWAVLTPFVGISATMQFPEAYYDALVYSLAVQLCQSYRRPVPANILATAAAKRKSLRELNAQILAGSYHQSRKLTGPNTGDPHPKALGPPEATLLPGAKENK